MPAPTPPKSVKNQCSVINNNVLYVYSPDAFQSIELKEDAKWEEHENGVSVTGAACVQATIDGDDSQQALYVIGGSTNSSTQEYSGLQRFSFENKTWETVDLPSDVMKNRLRHGANYIPRDHKLVVYGGSSVEGYEGASSETFTIDLQPPYPVDGYSSDAPPTSMPLVMPWGFDSVVMVGGSSTNTKVFTFTAGGGWVDLGVELPEPLPDESIAPGAMFTLDDGSKILQIFQLGQEPIGVTSHVLLNPGAQPATFGQVVGESTSSPPSGALARRQFLSNYPAYNDTSVPNTTRTDASIAQGDQGLLAIVGGDDDGSVTFFDQVENNWVPAERLLGDAPQQVLQPSQSSSSSSTTTPTASATASNSPSSTPAASGGGGGSGGSKTWTILGGVLGGLCGLVAILIIVLLCIRNKRRDKKRKEIRKSYPPGKKASTDLDFEDGTHPLRENGQPMGRSPVASQIIEDRGSAALFPSRPHENLIRRISSDNRSQPDQQAATYGIFRREKSPIGKSPLAISKPMNPNLGDYQGRPSIDLGRATPASPVNATPLVAIPSRNKSQRKTDEAWAKYFTGEKVNPTAEYKPHHKKSISGGFWPGTGVPSQPVAPKFAFRDSSGNTLQTRSVGTASPAYENGPGETRARFMPKQGRISNANSVSDDGSQYEDQEVDPAFSSGIPASVQGTYNNNWSEAAQRTARTESNYNPPPSAFTTSSTGDRSHSTGSSGIGSAGIPNFPMPASNASKVNVTQVQHPAATHARSTSREQEGYFPAAHQGDRPINTDVSWLNLGANQPRR